MKLNFVILDKNKSNIKPTLLIILFYLFYFYKMIVEPNSFISNLLELFMGSVGCVSFIYILAFKNLHRKRSFFGFVFLFVMSGVLSAIYSGNYRLEDFVLMFEYIGIGLILCKYTLNFKLIKYSFFLYSAYFLLQILLGIHPDDVFIGFSRNAVSVFMIIQTILIYISMFQSKKNLMISPALINLILSVWSIGRSGIISSLTLFLIILFLKNNKISIKTIFSYFGIFALLLFLVSYFYETIFKSAIERTVIMGVTDDSRGFIIDSYLNSISDSFGNMIFGVPIDKVNAFGVYSNNLHNSYLKLYSFHGLIGIVLVLVQIVNAELQFFKNKNFLYIGLFFIILLRISTDIAAFHGPFDPLIIYFIYMGFNVRNNYTF